MRSEEATHTCQGFSAHFRKFQLEVIGIESMPVVRDEGFDTHPNIQTTRNYRHLLSRFSNKDHSWIEPCSEIRSGRSGRTHVLSGGSF
jgi:hypothetical protein